MKSWEQVRNGCLAAALFGSIFVLGKAIAKPQTEQPSQPTYAFPKSVPLAGWQFVQSHPMETVRQTPSFAVSADDLAIAGQHYRYLRNGKTLDIETRYFFNSINDVTEAVKSSTLTRKAPELTAVSSPNGSYALFHRSGKLHLSACITPFQQTTVNDREFSRDQNRPLVLASRITPWFLGLSPLRDLRCVWTRLSIPSTSPDDATVNRNSQQAQDLEQAWSEWVQWWQKNYPPEP